MSQDMPVSGRDENPETAPVPNSADGDVRDQDGMPGPDAANPDGEREDSREGRASPGESGQPEDAGAGDLSDETDPSPQDGNPRGVGSGDRGALVPAPDAGADDDLPQPAALNDDGNDDGNDDWNGQPVWDEQVTRTAGRIRFGLKVQLWILGGLCALTCFCLLFMIFSAFRIVSMVYDGTISLLEQSVRPLMSFLDAGVYDADSFAALLKSYTGIAREVARTWHHAVFAFFVILSIPAVVTGIYSVAACLSAQRLKNCFQLARQYIWSSLCGRISLLAAVNASACALTALCLLFARSSLLLLATFNLCLPLTVWLMLRYFTVRIALNAVTDGRRPDAPSFAAAAVWVGLTLALLFALDMVLLPVAAMLPF